MAAPSYTNDFIGGVTGDTVALGDINVDAGTWDESTNGGWDTGGAMVDDLNLYYTDNSATPSCVSAQYTKAGTGSGATGPGTIIYVHTTAFTVPTDGVVMIQNLWAAPPALNVYAGTFGTAEAGVSVLVGTTLGDFDVHYVSGSDKPPAPEGGWTTYAVDPTLTPAGTVGTVTTTNAVGVAIAAGAQARGNPFACQSVRYGRGEVIYTVGDATTPATFAGYASIDNAAADRYGLLQEIEGGYKARGLMTFGTATTAVYFKDSDVSIVIADDLKVGTAFNKGVVNNATSTLIWNNVSITNLGTVSKYTFTVNNAATTTHTGCVFTDLGAFTYGTNSTNTNVTYRRQGLITNGSFTSCTFDTPTTTATANTTLDNYDSCVFTSDGTGIGVDISGTTISTNTSMAWKNTSSGYVDTAGNRTIKVTVDGTALLTINNNSSDTIFYENAGTSTAGANGDGVIVVTGAVTIDVHVQDAAQADIATALVYIDEDLGAAGNITNTTTDVNGDITQASYSGAATTATLRVRKYGYKPYVSTISLLTNSNNTVTMISDPQQI